MIKKKWHPQPGTPSPLGATVTSQGVNFAFFSQYDDDAALCLFDSKKSLSKPAAEIPLNPLKNRTGQVWHIFIKNLPLHLVYGYRIGDSSVLLDPYAKGVISSTQWGKPLSFQKKELGMRGEIVKEEFDWQGDTPLQLPLSDLIIYEMHVRGFTVHSSSGVTASGTFWGMVDKIPYLKELGVNAVELLPIFEFNEWECDKVNPKTKQSLCNYWGYSTVNFFSPCNRYGNTKQYGETRSSFKTLVRELHKAGIEVILDVVFNHTAEGNEKGPAFSFKGLGASTYYLLTPKGEYYNYSGCGNTLNANHPIVIEMILTSLRYWVVEMHVDGFRFDLASALTRGKGGQPLAHPPLIEAITNDPILSKTKLIAEAWDAAGLYQVGHFPGGSRWAEWNGRYRDSIRRFIKGSDHSISEFATRLAGSEDLYKPSHRNPYHSINFITSHDGFTLQDLVSYQGKRNEENGEDNRDGCNNNESWNCGVEGKTKDLAILALRERQKRNFIVALLVSQGVPMLTMGDEYGHTKKGNNNTWCQDNEKNWFLWDCVEKKNDFFSFVQKMIALRKKHSLLRQPHFLSERDIQWHGIEPYKPNWKAEARFLGFTLCDRENEEVLYIAFNASYQHQSIVLPPPYYYKSWSLVVDTFLPLSRNFHCRPLARLSYRLAAYSSLILKGSDIPDGI